MTVSDRKPHPDEVRVNDLLKNEPAPDSRRPLMIRMLTDRRLVVRVVRFALGLPTPLNTTCRKILEEQIFPYYKNRPDIKRILFVGCDWYTHHYPKEFHRSQEFFTIDPAPDRRLFGSKRHIVTSLEELDRHFADGFFDLIICNGVFGYGLNEQRQCELAFEQCYRCLRTNGEFVLGWDDIPEKTPIPLDNINSLKAFRRNISSCLQTWRYLTDTAYKHTFDFYIK